MTLNHLILIASALIGGPAMHVMCRNARMSFVLSLAHGALVAVALLAGILGTQ